MERGSLPHAAIALGRREFSARGISSSTASIIHRRESNVRRHCLCYDAADIKAIIMRVVEENSFIA